MTPRQVDVTYVLEGVPGVLEVYALGGQTAFAGSLRFAVRLEYGGGVLAAAHFALLRVLTYAECSSVLLFNVELPPGLRRDATHLLLSVPEREEAHARVPVRSPALEQQAVPRLRAHDRTDFRWLIVDADPAVPRALEGTFALAAASVVEADPVAALALAFRERFDLVLCDARVAFGSGGLLTQLYGTDRELARRVILVAHAGERELLVTNLDQLNVWNSFLCRPVEPATLLEILETGSVVLQWSSPEAEPPAPVRRVLVVDDDPATAMLLASTGSELEVVVTSDEWEAVDRVTEHDLDLVVCSVTLRTRGDTPFYRFLWNARPDIKRRFVFIARADSGPASGPASGSVVERPITRDVLTKLIDRFPRA